MTIIEIGVISSMVLSIFGAAFGIYNKVHKPQEDIEKKQAVQEALEKRQNKEEHEVEEKANILAKQLQWEKESNEKRFSQLTSGAECTNALAMNHIHTVDTKVEALQKELSSMKVDIMGQLVRLSTIIEERIPRK